MNDYTHACIKCGESYTDQDPDAYYCASCFEAKQALAAQIDATIANRPPKRPRVSALAEYDAAPKVNGFIKVTL